jgi:glycosyltransferase involved in cell wall biosynthesis
MREIAFVEVASRMSGVEFSTLYLAQHLDPAIWKALVICPEEGDLPERCRDNSVRVEIVPRARFFSTGVRLAKTTIPNPLAILANAVLMLASAVRLATFLRNLRPALVVPKGLLAQFYGGLAARQARVPCVWHVQDRVSGGAGPLYAWVLALAGRLLAKEIIVDAESIARQLQRIVPRARIHVIPNGVDVAEFSPQVDGSRVRAEWNVQPGELLVGVVGRLTPWKGQEVLLRAFAKIADELPQARLALIGAPVFDSDAFEQALREETARLGLGARVIFAGFRWDMPQVFAALDVVAHTALEKDSSPLAVVSAMAAGKAIVCSRVEGTAELFDEGRDGLLYPPGDVEALAEKLRLVLCDAERRTRLGSAARAKAERELSVEVFAQRCQAVFEQAIGKA